MNSSPKITVLMPVYNAETYLAEAIQSILEQSFTDFELLIINDASTDGSTAVIENFKDPRIRLIHNEQNFKIANTLNKGVQLAKGEFIARMDADDIALPKRLEKQIRFLEENPSVGILGTAFEMFDEEGKVTLNTPPTEIEELKAHLLFGCYIGHPTLMARRELLITNHYDASYCCEDYELWSRLLDKTVFANLPDVLLKYRLHTQQLTRKEFVDPSQDFKSLYHGMLVNYLKMQPSIVELNLHYYLSNHLAYGSPRLLSDYVHKLISHNKQVGFFDQNQFKNVLFKFCTFALKQLEAKVYSLEDFQEIQKIYYLCDQKLPNKKATALRYQAITHRIKNFFKKRRRWSFQLEKKFLYIDISKQNRTIQWLDPYTLPIFINARDRVNCLQTLVEWLLQGGYKNIIILDNASTYPPLVQYYQTLERNPGVKVVFLDQNVGAYSLWEANILKNLKIKTPFIYTDPDIIPIAQCPSDFMQYFLKVMIKTHFRRKVGFSLKIDDLPEHYRFKKEVMNWEAKFWSKPINEFLYQADLDTTFALYPGPPKKFVKNDEFYNAYRTSYPYTARHLPWYADTDHPTEEDLYYRQMADKASTTWCDTEVPDFIIAQTIS